jgi:hypothetical protein
VTGVLFGITHGLSKSEIIEAGSTLVVRWKDVSGAENETIHRFTGVNTEGFPHYPGMSKPTLSAGDTEVADPSRSE